jgi:ribosomal protein S12 methylthiotransferase
LKSQIPEKEKELRREIILNEQAAVSRTVNKTLIGKDLEVLIEEKSDRTDFAFMGRCRRQAPEIDGVTYVKTGKAQIGSIARCRIIAADDYDLFSEIIG